MSTKVQLTGGNYQDAAGNPLANGFLILELSQDGQVNTSTEVAAGRKIKKTEFSLLQAEVTRVQGSAKFNNIQLINATSSTITYQVGLNNTSSDQISVTFGGVSLSQLLAASTKISGTTSSSALASLAVIDSAIDAVSEARSKFGASINRLTDATSNIQTMQLNITAANSRIMDVDVASETASLSRNQVLTQAGASVLAQANQLPSLALKLLQ